MKKKDDFYSRLSFFLSLGFWIPLFNIGLSFISLYFGIKALRAIQNDNKKYCGLGYVIAGLVISISTIIFTLIFYSIYIHRKLTCANISIMDLL